MSAPATFSWKNYFLPTPKNLQYLAEGIQGLLVTIAGTNYFVGDAKVSFYIMIAVYLTGKASKFFGKVDQDQEEIKISIPAGNNGPATITRENHSADDINNSK